MPPTRAPATPERPRLIHDACHPGDALLLLEHASIGVAVFDDKWRCQWLNEKARQLAGPATAELAERSPWDVFTSDDWRRAEPALREAMAQRRSVQLDGMVGAEGRVFDLTFVPLPSGGGALYADDVTSHARAEGALRQANTTLATLISSSPLALYSLDANFRVGIWNAAAERLFGWTAAEVVGGEPPFFPADRSEEVEEIRAQVLREGKSVTRLATERRRKDGKAIAVRISVAPLRSEETGEITGAVAYIVDMTEHRALEDQLRQSQKMEAVGQLAGGIAHDFNNLLTVIKVHAEMMIQELAPSHDLRTDLQEIQAAALRASNLTRQLLAFGRKQLLQPKVLDLGTVVDALEPMLRRLIREDIFIQLRRGRDLRPVLADPGQLELVLINLAVNARDAMPRGGLLTIETSNVDLDADVAAHHPSGAPAGKYVLMSVGDTGSGMDRATLARIFEPFFTTKEPGKGTGLGLPTVYGIAKQSGAYLDVSSVVGEGTLFSIYFPVTTATSGPGAGAPSAGDDMPRGTETLLLVEDEDAVRNLARRILIRLGYDVIEASNGRHALELAGSYSGMIHLLITDAVMPELGGPDLVSALLPFRPETAVVFMSGYTNDEILRRGLTDQEVNFLSKPFTAVELARATRNALDGKRVGR